MNDSTSGASRGLVDSLTAVGASLVGIVHTRLDLLSTDLEEDRARFTSIAIFSLAGLFGLGVGVVLASVLLAATFWETHRLLVLTLLAVVFLVAGALALRKAAHQAKIRPRLLDSSLAELRKDGLQLAPRR